MMRSCSASVNGLSSCFCIGANDPLLCCGGGDILPDKIFLFLLRKQKLLFKNANEEHQRNDSSLNI